MAHRIGIIGLGIMGQRMLVNMTAHPAFEVAAAFDASPEAMARLRREHPQIAAAGSVEALARSDIAALYIASPPISHPQYVTLGWDNGRAVFCEKPLTVGLAEAEALVRRAEAEKRVAAINFPFASAPAVQMIAQALASGALGTLRSIEIAVAFAAWPRDWQKAGRWLSERAEGGFVREVVSHFLFLAQRLAGPLAVIEAKPVYPPDGVGAETAITARLTAGEVPVTLRGAVGTTAAADENECVLTGSAGAFRLHGWYMLQRHVGETWQEVDFGGGPAIRQRSYMAQLDALAAMLEGRPHRLPSLAEGLGVQRAVETMLAN
jgi:predicted dehydrogenase